MNSSAILKNQVLILKLTWLILFAGCQGVNSQEEKINGNVRNSKEVEAVQEAVINSNLLQLEMEYADMLTPILSLKTSDSRIYWFIVSWLNTAYSTPIWKGYYSEDWMNATKLKGIDCSGFARVMLDQMFDNKVRGSSQGIMNHYCTPIKLKSLEIGDLVFFKAPSSESHRIVHIGVYLKDNYFVHATSAKSADKGLGLSVNSLNEVNWSAELVACGRVKR